MHTDVLMLIRSGFYVHVMSVLSLFFPFLLLVPDLKPSEVWITHTLLCVVGGGRVKLSTSSKTEVVFFSLSGSRGRRRAAETAQFCSLVILVVAVKSFLISAVLLHPGGVIFLQVFCPVAEHQVHGQRVHS